MPAIRVPRARRAPKAPKAGRPRFPSQQNYGSKEEWKALAKTVKERDRYTCQGKGCGCTDRTKLQVHHIIPLSKGGANSPRNLITLCVRCHAKRHPSNHHIG